METRIQAVHFDASQQLVEFVEKKVAKLEIGRASCRERV